MSVCPHLLAAALHYGSAPLAPGRVHALHDLDVMIAGNVARYELSVLKAEFANGS